MGRNNGNTQKETTSVKRRKKKTNKTGSMNFDFDSKPAFPSSGRKPVVHSDRPQKERKLYTFFKSFKPTVETEKIKMDGIVAFLATNNIEHVVEDDRKVLGNTMVKAILPTGITPIDVILNSVKVGEYKIFTNLLNPKSKEKSIAFFQKLADNQVTDTFINKMKDTGRIMFNIKFKEGEEEKVASLPSDIFLKVTGIYNKTNNSFNDEAMKKARELFKVDEAMTFEDLMNLHLTQPQQQ